MRKNEHFCRMKITLVISVYKDVEALTAVLRTAALQTFNDFDIIISQDCDSDCFDQLLEAYQGKLKIKHLQQADEGFLKNRMLNKAIKEAASDKMVFIDGDCILHPHFIEQYERCINPGVICMGRRIDLDPVTTHMIKSGKTIYPGFFSMIKNKTTRVEESFYLPRLSQRFHSIPKLLGCNMGWHRSDLIKLNGFDEDYNYPGYGEDTDMAWRAQMAGIGVFSVRYKTIQYHLDHERPNREKEVSKSQLLFEEKKKCSDFRCLNGLEKLQ